MSPTVRHVRRIRRVCSVSCGRCSWCLSCRLVVTEQCAFAWGDSPWVCLFAEWNPRYPQRRRKVAGRRYVRSCEGPSLTAAPAPPAAAEPAPVATHDAGPAVTAVFGAAANDEDDGSDAPVVFDPSAVGSQAPAVPPVVVIRLPVAAPPPAAPLAAPAPTPTPAPAAAHSTTTTAYLAAPPPLPSSAASAPADATGAVSGQPGSRRSSTNDLTARTSAPPPAYLPAPDVHTHPAAANPPVVSIRLPPRYVPVAMPVQAPGGAAPTPAVPMDTQPSAASAAAAPAVAVTPEELAVCGDPRRVVSTVMANVAAAGLAKAGCDAITAHCSLDREDDQSRAVRTYWGAMSAAAAVTAVLKHYESDASPVGKGVVLAALAAVQALST